ncbi:dehydration-responsive element-binding protein 1F [Jatropha curcas]|uniref:dehydration-responsive element-binding protein 1F n=1 Tax=Jatropha curcas TaxID=180498 RepID=UPI001893C22B|nr:dehydration-responsive element-binding protein 1F [Jatropha curcas]
MEDSSSSSSSQSSPSYSYSSSSSSITSHQIGVQKRKAERKKFRETRHPVYKGVRRKNGKWVSELRELQTKSRIWLGTFPNPEMAARAYDVAVKALRGNTASLNFPETAHLLPQVGSTSIKDIQCAALEAAGVHGGGGDVQCASSSSSLKASVEEGYNNNNNNNDNKMFLDEEELFNMPALLDSMAEGLILTPPAMKRGFSWNDTKEEDTVDLTLWSD